MEAVHPEHLYVALRCSYSESQSERAEALAYFDKIDKAPGVISACATLPPQWVGKKPRWAAWWQWVQEPRNPDGMPLSFEDFQNAFKRADQEFSSKMTSRDPVLLAMLWASVLEEANPPEVLAIGR
jgi:hypothetical protein